MYNSDEWPLGRRKIRRTGPRARRYAILDKAEKEGAKERLDALHLKMDELLGTKWRDIPREWLFSRAYRAGQATQAPAPAQEMNDE